MIKDVLTTDLYYYTADYLRPLFDSSVYPWDILPQIKSFVLKQIALGMDGYRYIGDGILVGDEVNIHSSAVIEGPAIIGSGTEVRPGAYIRGSVIVGQKCVIGNSTELKNCILLDGVQVPHYNYVGDSILGNYSHLGAGVVCSNLKTDGSNVVVHGDADYHTELRKVGAFLGDGADVGCGCVLNPGTVIGRNTSVYPLTSLRGVYPADCIVKNCVKYVKRG